LITFRVTLKERGPMTISADDMVIFDDLRTDLVLFLLQGVPKWILPLETIEMIEQASDGDWIGKRFDQMLANDNEYI
jgi:hypothetical protein